MAQSVASGDFPTRKMSLLFFMSLAAVVVVCVLGIERYRDYRHLHARAHSPADDASKNLNEFIQKQAEAAKHRSGTLPLGKFTVSVKPPEDAVSGATVVNMAEIEIVVECDNKETREYLDDNLAQAQDQITTALAQLERDDLLTKDGKRKLKKRLVEKLNSWLPYGKIEDLYFSSLILS